MSIGHLELRALSGRSQLFPEIGERMRGATIEVSVEHDGAVQDRTHLIVESGDFPRVLIAAEGSTGRPAERQFFAPTGIYDGRALELADAADEAALRLLIAGKREQDAAAAAAVHVEMEGRPLARAAAEREAEALRTQERRAAAQLGLLAAYREGSERHRWDAALLDLDLLAGTIAREADRSFVGDLAAKWRRFRFPLSERQVAWLADILRRTARRLEAAARSGRQQPGN